MLWLLQYNFNHVQHCRQHCCRQCIIIIIAAADQFYFFRCFVGSFVFIILYIYCDTLESFLVVYHFDFTARNRSICTPPTVNVAAYRLWCVNKFNKIDWHESMCSVTQWIHFVKHCRIDLLPLCFLAFSIRIRNSDTFQPSDSVTYTF